MAIAFVASTEANTTATTVTVSVPGGVSNGHTLILISQCGDSDFQGTDTPSTPSGWTLVTGPHGTAATGASTPTVTVYRRTASSEPASYAVGGTVNTGRYGVMLAFSGVDTTTPIDATSTTATGNGNNPDPASITTVTTGACVIAIGQMDDSGGTFLTGAPTNYTLAQEGTSPNDESANGGRCAVAYRILSGSGAENPGAFSGGSATEQWGAVTMALRPAGSGTSITAAAFASGSASAAATTVRGHPLSAAAFAAGAASMAATTVRGHPISVAAFAAGAASMAATTVHGHPISVAAFAAGAASFAATLGISEGKELGPAAFAAGAASFAATLQLPSELDLGPVAFQAGAASFAATVALADVIISDASFAAGAASMAATLDAVRTPGPCDARQLTEAERVAGYQQQRTGVPIALRPFSGRPTIENLIDYINRELQPAVTKTRKAVNDVYLQATDNAPSGNPLQFYFSTETSNADPTVGRLRLDAATQNTATTVRVSETNARLQGVGAWLDIMAGGATTPLGTVALIDAINPTRMLRFDLNTMVDQGAYWDLGVTIVESTHDNPFVDAGAVCLSFTPGVAAAGATVPVGSLSPIATETFLGNISGGTAPPAAVPLASVDSTSIVYDPASHEFRRAAVTGFADIAANANTSTSAEPIVTFATSGNMTNERVATSSTSITVSTGVAGQIEFQSAAKTGFAVAAANSNATTSAEPIVTFSASSNMSNERVLSNGTNTTVSTAVANQISINVDDFPLSGLADIAAGTQLGRQIDAGTGVPVALTGLEQGENIRFQTTQTHGNTGAGVTITLNDDATVLTKTGGASVNIIGITGGAAGRILFLRHTSGGGSTTTLEHDSGSTASDGFQCPGGVPFVYGGALGTSAYAAFLIYSSTAQRWLVFPRGFGRDEAIAWGGTHTFTGGSVDVDVTGAANFIANSDVAIGSTAGGLSLGAGAVGTFIFESPDVQNSDIVVNAQGGLVLTAGLAAGISTATNDMIHLEADNIDLTGDVLFNQRCRFNAIVSSTMNGGVNNFDVSTANVARLTPQTSQRNLTGMVAGGSGQVVLLVNASSTIGVRIVDETDTTNGTDSTAANRFNLRASTSATVDPRGLALAWYDGTSSRWRVEFG